MASGSGSREVRVRVKPGSRKGPLVETADADPDADLLVFVRERAVEGEANKAVERVVAAYLGVPRSKVSLIRGARSRIKVLRVAT